MDIQEVYDVIHKIVEGFEDNVVKCLDNHSGNVIMAISDQLYSGIDGDDQYLSPNYDNDPFFDLEGQWQNNSEGYKAWKMKITPPVVSSILGLNPRPDNVPNLFITGKFYSDITAKRSGDMLLVSPGQNDGPSIVSKYGEQILELSSRGVAYFNTEFLIPAIKKFYLDCGYK